MRATFSETSVGERRRRRSLVLVSKGSTTQENWPRWMGGVADLQSCVKLGICRHLERTVGRAYHMLRALFLRLNIQDCDGD